MNTTNETGKSKEAETPQEAWIRIYSGDSNINSQFTIFKTGFHAGRDTGRQQSAVDKERMIELQKWSELDAKDIEAGKYRIKQLEAALLEIKRDIYENDVCDVVSIIDKALNK